MITVGDYVVTKNKEYKWDFIRFLCPLNFCLLPSLLQFPLQTQMASLHRRRHLLLLALLSLSLKAANGNSQLIKDTCTNTSFFDLCMSTLLSTPSSSTADTKGLTAIVIQTAISNATDTAAFVLQLAKTTTGIAQKILVDNCNGSYVTSAGSHGVALQLLQGDDFHGVAARLRECYGYPGSCLEMFKANDVPYPPELASRETVLENLDVVAMNITAQLG